MSVAAVRPARAAAVAAVALGLFLLGGGVPAGQAAASSGFYYCQDGLVDTSTDDALANGSNCAFWLLGAFPSGGRDEAQPNQSSLPGLDVFAVWATTKGAGVTVAVLDTGIDPASFDVLPNLLTGRNLYENSSDTSDRDGHGSLVASIIGAEAGNGGYVGIAPEAHLLPVKIMGDVDGTRLSGRAAVAGIYYAIGHGARVINCSFGSFGVSMPGMAAALKAAAHADVLVVIAAGNQHASLDRAGTVFAPDGAGLTNTLTVANVAATSGRLSPDSNWGARHVQVASFGDYLYGDFPGSKDGGYLGGTSAAAATVSGVAALLRAAYPHATAAQVARAISRGSTPLAALRGKVGSGGVVSATGALRMLAAELR
jgi:subtilisin family serine protease